MLGDDPKDRTPKLDKADLRRIGVFRHLRSIPENACRKARVEFSVHTPCDVTDRSYHWIEPDLLPNHSGDETFQPDSAWNPFLGAETALPCVLRRRVGLAPVRGPEEQFLGTSLPSRGPITAIGSLLSGIVVARQCALAARHAGFQQGLWGARAELRIGEVAHAARSPFPPSADAQPPFSRLDGKPPAGPLESVIRYRKLTAHEFGTVFLRSRHPRSDLAGGTPFY